MNKAQRGSSLALWRRRNPEETRLFVVSWVFKLVKDLGCKDTMTGDEVVECSRVILKDYYFLKAKELVYIGRLILTGQKGDFNYRFKMPDLMKVIRDYDINERARYHNYHRDESIVRTKYIEAETDTYSGKQKKLNNLNLSRDRIEIEKRLNK